MLFNYHVIQVNTGVWCIERLGIQHHIPLANWDDEQQAQNVARLLYMETTEMATLARNEAVNDIRREIFQGMRPLRIPALSALPHVAKAQKPEDVAISITITEMAQALDELAELRRIVAENVRLVDLQRMGYGVEAGNALIARCEAQSEADNA